MTRIDLGKVEEKTNEDGIATMTVIIAVPNGGTETTLARRTGHACGLGAGAGAETKVGVTTGMTERLPGDDTTRLIDYLLCP